MGVLTALFRISSKAARKGVSAVNDRAPIGGRWGFQRRTSFARRDANLALAGAVVSGTLIAFALLLLVLARVDPDMGSRVRGAVLDLLSPVISVVTAPVKAGRALVAWVDAHVGVVDENRRLKAELAALKAEARASEARAKDIRRLERLLALRRPERRLIASGMASASAATGAQRTATISVGVQDGVRPRMPVLAPQGLAGRVTDVGLGSARVMLVSDGNSRVPVILERTGWTGIATGTGAVDLLFQFDPASGTDRIRVGDRLVTSGDGGLFPPGIPVAVIVDAEANPPRARPFVVPGALSAVSVEAPWLPPPDPVPSTPAEDEADRPVVAPAPAPKAPPGSAVPQPVASQSAGPRPAAPQSAAPQSAAPQAAAPARP
jgi:rod shape-determining protein MreC